MVMKPGVAPQALSNTNQIYVSTAPLPIGKFCYARPHADSVGKIAGIETDGWSWVQQTTMTRFFWYHVGVSGIALTPLTEKDVVDRNIPRDTLTVFLGRGLSPITPMSIEEWIEKNKGNLDAALAAEEVKVYCP
jgi:hypothetical protein